MTRGEPVASYVRGCAWPGTDDIPYPRADPDDLTRLPLDTVASARLPVGVRLELVGDAEVVEISYTTRTDDFGYRGPAAGRCFTVVRARKIEKFLSQPMFVAAQFTGLEGKYVKIEDTVRSFKEIVEGKYDDIPEQAFYMVGTIEEALQKAEKMKAGV